MAAFANAEGGYIIFGIQDRPRVPIGVRKDSIDDVDLAKITSFLNEHFSPEIKWEIGTVDVSFHDGKTLSFGYIYTYPAEKKPVICRKQHDSGNLREGAIYYRYRGQTKEIRYEELHMIIQETIAKEREQWMRVIKRIATSGVNNIAVLDLTRQDLTFFHKDEDRVVLIDAEIVDQLKEKVVFVEEGKFSETEGEPALRLIGEVQPIDFDPNRTHPYNYKTLAKELSKQLGIEIKQYDVQALVYKLDLKGNRKFHMEVRGLHMFSDLAKHRITSFLQTRQSEEDVDLSSYLTELRKEYFKAIREKRGEQKT